MEHDFQNFNELCFFRFFLYFCDKKAGEKNTQLKKHLFFLFKVYYSPMVDYTERRNFCLEK
jgi:hypothetical protein